MANEKDNLMTGLEEATKSQPKQSTFPTFESEADIDRYFTEIQAKDMQAEKEREEARIRTEKSLRNLSDLAGVFTDMMKASGGAVVGPREIEAHYNRLDERQKQVYDTYRTRMDLLRKQQADRAMRRAQEQRAAQQYAEGLASRERIAQTQANARVDAAKESAAARIEAARQAAQARIKTRSLPSGEQEMIVPFAGQEYAIKKNAYDGRMAQLYAYLDENNLFPEASQAGSDDLKNVMAFFKNGNVSNAAEGSRAKLAIAVNVALGHIPADSEHAANIIGILNGTYGKPAAQAAKPAQATSANQTTTKTAPWVKK